jgi:hypothetical protein
VTGWSRSDADNGRRVRGILRGSGTCGGSAVRSLGCSVIVLPPVVANAPG